MILQWLPIAALAVTTLLLFSLIYRAALYLSIPAMLFFAAFAHEAVNQALGYPTHDISDLLKKHTYLAHWGTGPAFLVAIPEGALQPRLYYLEELPEEGEESLDEMKGRTAQGIAQEGQLTEGEFQRNDMDPAKALGPKK